MPEHVLKRYLLHALQVSLGIPIREGDYSTYRWKRVLTVVVVAVLLASMIPVRWVGRLLPPRATALCTCVSRAKEK